MATRRWSIGDGVAVPSAVRRWRWRGCRRS